MAWSEGPSERGARLPADWQRRRLDVLRRDSYACQAKDSHGVRCLEHANQVDHVERGDDHSLANLQALCEWHHKKKTAREGGDAAASAHRVRYASRFRPREAHPGLL